MMLAVILAAGFMGAVAQEGGGDALTFQAKGHSNVRWTLQWQGQGLKYPEGAVVEKIQAVFKDGMAGNKAKIEFYKNYDGAGNFSGLIGSEIFTIPKPNNGAVYTFKSPVELSGKADGLYYLKLSPAEGGVVHGLYLNDDDGSDALRHGIGPDGGMAYFSNAPAGLNYATDMGALTIYTRPLSKEEALKAGEVLAEVAKAEVEARKALPNNVMSFGAKGDGESNDTAAFAEALAQGGSLYVPAGTYLIGPEMLDIPKNLVLRGDGRATVLKAAPETTTLFLLASGAQLRDLAIDGKNVEPAGAARGLIVIARADGCVIDSVYVTDCDRPCVMSNHANDLLIQNCDFRKVGWGVSLQFSNRIKVLGNTVVDARGHGLQFWGSAGSGKGKECERIESEDLIFANNYVKNGGGAAIWGSGGRRVILNGNIVDGCHDVGIDPEFCEDVVITGNVTRNCRNAGISLFFSCKRVSITGNTIYNNSVPNDKQKAAIFSVLQRELTEEEMDLPWYVRSGIWLTSPNRQKMATDTGHENITIVGNTIYTEDGDGIPRRDIWIGAEVKNVRIEGNTLSGKGVYYGGHHMAKQNLEKLGPQPLMIDNRPTPDKPKF